MPTRTTYSSALSPEFALLGFLAQKPAHGYDLHLRLTAELGQVWHVSQSQVYNILNRLESRGYITATVQAQEKLPARRRLRLTAAGRKRFDIWLHTTAGCSVRAIRVEFTTRLYFATALDPTLARRLIEDQVAETRAGLDRLSYLLAELPPDQTFNHLGLELRIRQLTSILDWLADCQKTLGFSA
jgi:PadR family transcriptional regulator, regulatory protein AphA